jgi:phosphoribosylglycinamide formyltransferase-1
MTETVFRSPKKRGRIAVFLSGRGSNFRAIHGAIEKGDINGDIVLVFSNKKQAPGLLFAREIGLETATLSHKEFDSREDYDRAVVGLLDRWEVDLVCLAGYMRILTTLLCETYRNRIINIHPALLPSFPGLDVQQKAIDWGVRFSGATVPHPQGGAQNLSRVRQTLFRGKTGSQGTPCLHPLIPSFQP